MKNDTYMILNYDKVERIKQILGLSDEQFKKVLTGEGYLTTEKINIGDDEWMRVGTFIDKADTRPMKKSTVRFPLGVGITGIYEALKKRREYGLNDNEMNYFTEKSESELRSFGDDIAHKAYLVKNYREYIKSFRGANNRIKKCLALNELYINNRVNGRDLYKGPDKDTMLDAEMEVAYC